MNHFVSIMNTPTKYKQDKIIMKSVHYQKRRKNILHCEKNLFLLFKVLVSSLYLCFPWHSSDILVGAQALKYRISFQKISVKMSRPCLTLKSSGIKTYTSVPVQNFCVLNISNPFSLLNYTQLQQSNILLISQYTHTPSKNYD